MAKQTLKLMREIARGAIERHLGDVVTDHDSAETLYDNAFVLAHDALVESGVDNRTASVVASSVARETARAQCLHN